MKDHRKILTAVATLGILATALFGGAGDVSASVLVEDGFAGAAGTTPDAGKFEWSGEATQNGAGLLTLNTTAVSSSWLRSRAGAAPGAGETLVLHMRAKAYAEGWDPGIYGDGQLRGLRVGTDANNAVEFYSLSRTSVGMRLRKDGVESLGSYALPSGVDALHDYEISVTPAEVSFKVDGAVAGTFTSNIPTGALNAYVSTFDGYAGQVPVSLDSLSLSLTGGQPPPAISGFAPGSGPPGTSVVISGTNFTGVTGVQFHGVSATFTCDSDSQITATVPPGATSGVITVIGPGGSVTSTDGFSVFAVVAACTEANLDAALSGNFGKVIFACDGVIDLTTTKVISSDITLDANGHNITLSGGGAVRVLTVNPGVHLTLRNLNIANGGGTTAGGGIYSNGGVVEAVGCAFTDNAVVGAANGGNAFGGAIYNDNGSLILTGCTLANNTVTGGVGNTGAYSAGTGGAGGNGYGGAILNSGGSVVIANCTFQTNRAVGGAGGAGGHGYDGYTYWVSGPFGSGHTETVPGGPGGHGGDGGNGFGGSLHSSSGGTVTMLNVTMASGSSSGGGGGAPGSPGAYGYGDYGWGASGSSSLGGNICIASGAATLKNTIVAYGNGTPGFNCSGTLIDDGNNICSDTTAGFSLAGSLNNMDPLLASALAPNGGPTMTIALLPQSPAIDAGDDAVAPPTDQRDLPRAGRSDIGAFELQKPVISGFTPASGLPGASVTISGANFFAITAVKFAGVEATFTTDSASQITATVPATATTGPITVASANGTAASQTAFVVEAPEFTYETYFTGQDAYTVITGYTGPGGAVTIPNTLNGGRVTAIVDWAFANCISLTSVTLGDNVGFVRDWAFSGCTSLIAIAAPVANPNFSSEDGVLFNKLKTALVKYPPGKSGSYTIPPGVTSIGNAAFYGCSNLEAVTIPDCVTSIGDDAFSGCTGLSHATIPGSVNTIGSYAFDFCTSLTGAEFLGDAPSIMGGWVFDHAASAFTVKYHGAASGFTSPTWMGYASVNLDATSPSATWQATNFTPDDVATGRTTMTADFDRDGMANLLEYAFGKNPKAPDASGIIPNVSGGKMQISFKCDATRTDITYTVQASSNLSTWEDIAESVGGAVTVQKGSSGCAIDDPGTGLRTVTVTEASAFTGKRFLRIKVATP
ncbi:MAG: leucine-rich repeat protein [Terrimicrobiaceae bacterium]